MKSFSHLLLLGRLAVGSPGNPRTQSAFGQLGYPKGALESSDNRRNVMFC